MMSSAIPNSIKNRSSLHETEQAVACLLNDTFSSSFSVSPLPKYEEFGYANAESSSKSQVKSRKRLRRHSDHTYHKCHSRRILQSPVKDIRIAEFLTSDNDDANFRVPMKVEKRKFCSPSDCDVKKCCEGMNCENTGEVQIRSKRQKMSSPEILEITVPDDGDVKMATESGGESLQCGLKPSEEMMMDDCDDVLQSPMKVDMRKHSQEVDDGDDSFQLPMKVVSHSSCNSIDHSCEVGLEVCGETKNEDLPLEKIRKVSNTEVSAVLAGKDDHSPDVPITIESSSSAISDGCSFEFSSKSFGEKGYRKTKSDHSATIVANVKKLSEIPEVLIDDDISQFLEPMKCENCESNCKCFEYLKDYDQGVNLQIDGGELLVDNGKEKILTHLWETLVFADGTSMVVPIKTESTSFLGSESKTECSLNNFPPALNVKMESNELFENVLISDITEASIVTHDFISDIAPVEFECERALNSCGQSSTSVISENLLLKSESPAEATVKAVSASSFNDSGFQHYLKSLLENETYIKGTQGSLTKFHPDMRKMSNMNCASDGKVKIDQTCSSSSESQLFIADCDSTSESGATEFGKNSLACDNQSHAYSSKNSYENAKIKRDAPLVKISSMLTTSSEVPFEKSSLNVLKNSNLISLQQVNHFDSGHNLTKRVNVNLKMKNELSTQKCAQKLINPSNQINKNLKNSNTKQKSLQNFSKQMGSSKAVFNVEETTSSKQLDEKILRNVNEEAARISSVQMTEPIKEGIHEQAMITLRKNSKSSDIRYSSDVNARKTYVNQMGALPVKSSKKQLKASNFVTTKKLIKESCVKNHREKTNKSFRKSSCLIKCKNFGSNQEKSIIKSFYKVKKSEIIGSNKVTKIDLRSRNSLKSIKESSVKSNNELIKSSLKPQNEHERQSSEGLDELAKKSIMTMSVEQSTASSYKFVNKSTMTTMTKKIDKPILVISNEEIVNSAVNKGFEINCTNEESNYLFAKNHEKLNINPITNCSSEQMKCSGMQDIENQIMIETCFKSDNQKIMKKLALYSCSDEAIKDSKIEASTRNINKESREPSLVHNEEEQSTIHSSDRQLGKLFIKTETKEIEEHTSDNVFKVPNVFIFSNLSTQSRVNLECPKADRIDWFENYSREIKTVYIDHVTDERTNSSSHVSSTVENLMEPYFQNNGTCRSTSAIFQQPVESTDHDDKNLSKTLQSTSEYSTEQTMSLKNQLSPVCTIQETPIIAHRKPDHEFEVFQIDAESSEELQRVPSVEQTDSNNRCKQIHPQKAKYDSSYEYQFILPDSGFSPVNKQQPDANATPSSQCCIASKCNRIWDNSYTDNSSISFKDTSRRFGRYLNSNYWPDCNPSWVTQQQYVTRSQSQGSCFDGKTSYVFNGNPFHNLNDVTYELKDPGCKYWQAENNHEQHNQTWCIPDLVPRTCANEVEREPDFPQPRNYETIFIKSEPPDHIDIDADTGVLFEDDGIRITNLDKPQDNVVHISSEVKSGGRGYSSHRDESKACAYEYYAHNPLDTVKYLIDDKQADFNAPAYESNQNYCQGGYAEYYDFNAQRGSSSCAVSSSAAVENTSQNHVYSRHSNLWCSNLYANPPESTMYASGSFCAQNRYHQAAMAQDRWQPHLPTPRSVWPHPSFPTASHMPLHRHANRDPYRSGDGLGYTTWHRVPDHQLSRADTSVPDVPTSTSSPPLRAKGILGGGPKSGKISQGQDAAGPPGRHPEPERQTEADSASSQLDDIQFKRATAAFATRQYQHLLHLLESHSYGARYHGQLQAMWNEAHYALVQRSRVKTLGPVDRYRIRKRYPFPDTIWDGDATLYCFKEKSRLHLNQEFEIDQYPSPSRKQVIAAKTGLTVGQVSNWFKNRRQRNSDSKQRVHVWPVRAGRPKKFECPPSSSEDSYESDEQGSISFNAAAANNQQPNNSALPDLADVSDYFGDSNNVH